MLKNTAESECLKETERVEVYFDLSGIDTVVLDLDDYETMSEMLEKVKPVLIDELEQAGLDVMTQDDYYEDDEFEGEGEFEMEVEFDPEFEMPEDVDLEKLRDGISNALSKLQVMYCQYCKDPNYITVVISGMADVVTHEHALVTVGVMSRAIGVVVPTYITRTRYVMQPHDVIEVSRADVIKAKKELKGDNV